MTDNTTPDNSQPATPEQKRKAQPEPLALRARPLPVTRINRRVLIGGAAVILAIIAALVLVALQPPSLRSSAPQELYNVDRKPITDRLAGLPATYEGTGERPPNAGERPSPPVGKVLQVPSTDPTLEAERVEKAKLARMAGQAREAPVFFRLQLKSATRETATAKADNRRSRPGPPTKSYERSR